MVVVWTDWGLDLQIQIKRLPQVTSGRPSYGSVGARTADASVGVAGSLTYDCRQDGITVLL